MKKVFPAILLLLLVGFFALNIFHKDDPPQKNLPQSSSTGYWVVNISNNKSLIHTSFPLSIGDEYISADNKIYRVVKIVKDKAYVEEIH